MIQSKLSNIGESIFSEMSRLAAEHNAINLSQGYPDFMVSESLVAKVNKFMLSGKNQYAPMPGVVELRKKIAQKVEKLYGKAYDYENEVTVTAGATQALYTAFSAFLKEDDEVIIFEPAYDQYAPAVRISGASPVYVGLKAPAYKIDWDEVKKVVNARTKMIVLNSPHNPTGAILDESDFEELQRIVLGSNIIILSDEVYQHIIYDDQKHHSVALYPEIAERSILIASFGKTFHATGWKIGYAVAPQKLMKEFRKIHQFIVFTVNTPIQYALAEHLENEDEYLLLGKFYQQKRDYFIKLVEEKTHFKVIPTSGTYFQLLSYDGLSDMKEKEFAEYLTKEIGVASIPVSSFYHDKTDRKTLRFCFAKSNDTLEKAVELLAKVKPLSE